VLKSKGLQTLDDLDGPEEDPLLKLQPHHSLVFIVELCEAQRPSKLGSLKGSHEKYLDELSRLEQTVELLRGDGAVEVIRWEPGMPVVPSSSSSMPQQTGGAVMAGATPSGGRRSRPQSAGVSRAASRPQSAAAGSQNARLRAYLGVADPSERLAPRIGAFEVSYKLVNTQSGQQYGPVEIFSKIRTGTWPGSPSLLLKRVHEQLQGFLQIDMGAGMLFQHAQALAKEAKADARGAKPVLQSAADLPDDAGNDAPAPDLAPAPAAQPAAAPAEPPPAAAMEEERGGTE